MDIKEIRTLLREGRSVVLVEDGQPPLLVSELHPQPEPQSVPIARPPVRPDAPRQDQVLERLNKEILALKAQIDEEGMAGN